MRKQIILLIVSIAFLKSGYSQDIKFGAQAGINFSGASAKNTDEKFKGSPLPGLEAGVFADIPLANGLSFHPGALFSYEGYKPKIDPFKASIHIFYFKLPLDVVYHLQSGGGKFFFGLGPYVGFALAGKYHRSGGDSPTVSPKISFGNDENTNDLKRLDFGLNLLAGYQVQKDLFVTAKFDLGLINISPSKNDVVYHTRSFALSACYLLGSK
jgi:hypothetical protein